MNNQSNQSLSIDQILIELKTELTLRPSDSFRKNAKIRIINTLSTADSRVRAANYRSTWLTYSLRYAFLSVVLLASTVYAAQYSKPNETLFPLKVLSERIALAVSPNQKIKTTVASTIINRRAAEVKQAQTIGNTVEIQKRIEAFDSAVTTIQKTHLISQDEITKELHSIESEIHQDTIDSSKRESEHNQTLPSVKGVSTKAPNPTKKHERNFPAMSPKQSDIQKDHSSEYVRTTASEMVSGTPKPTELLHDIEFDH